MAKELALTDKEESFIANLLDNGGNVKQAYVAAGYDPRYAHTAAYTIRKRLAKEIAEATQHYIAFHAPKAAHRVIAMMTEDMPNPTHLSAAKDILDRAGAKVKEEIQQVSVVKANIFILPEKKLIEEAKIIDVEEI
jgi:ATP phosphoribosyltransferase